MLWPLQVTHEVHSQQFESCDASPHCRSDWRTAAGPWELGRSAALSSSGRSLSCRCQSLAERARRRMIAVCCWLPTCPEPLSSSCRRIWAPDSPVAARRSKSRTSLGPSQGMTLALRKLRHASRQLQPVWQDVANLHAVVVVAKTRTSIAQWRRADPATPAWRLARYGRRDQTLWRSRRRPCVYTYRLVVVDGGVYIIVVQHVGQRVRRWRLTAV